MKPEWHILHMIPFLSLAVERRHEIKASFADLMQKVIMVVVGAGLVLWANDKLQDERIAATKEEIKSVETRINQRLDREFQAVRDDIRGVRTALGPRADAKKFDERKNLFGG